MAKLINEQLGKGIYVIALSAFAYLGLKLQRPNYEILYRFSKKKRL
jgi:hypothetical protein